MPFALAVAIVVEDAVREACRGHVLTPGEERAELVKEEGRGAVLVHAFQEIAKLTESAAELSKEIT